MVRFVNNIVKDFPDMIHIVIYRDPQAFVVPERGSCKDFEKKRSASLASINKTKTTISDLIKANDFDLFATFTIDPKKYDRFNYDLTLNIMKKWLHNQKDSNSPDLAYIFVPERHKNGAYHFHALLKNFNGRLSDSGHKKNGRVVYNITGYRAGFSTAVKIDNKEAVCNYVKKYITKDFCLDFNRHRFFASKNLKRPTKTINSKLINRLLPLNKIPTYQDDLANYYDISKNDLLF